MIINTQATILTALHVVVAGRPDQIDVLRRHRPPPQPSVRRRRPRHRRADGGPHCPEVIVPAVLGGRPDRRPGFAVGNPLASSPRCRPGSISGLDRTFSLGEWAHAVGDDPVRRRRQPGQLRRPAAQHERSGDRDRDRPRQPRRDRRTLQASASPSRSPRPASAAGAPPK